MEIEFVEDPAEQVAADRAPALAPTVRRLRALDVAAVPAFLAASALAVAAPFERFYLISVKSGGFGETLAYDGWGRLAARPAATSAGLGQHGARYGTVAEVLAALGVLVAAGCALVVLRGMPRPARAAVALAGTVFAAAVGVCFAMAWLDAAAVIDSARHLAAPDVGRTLDDRFAFHGEYGAFLWLLLAAIGCGIAGTAATVRRLLSPGDVCGPPYPTPPVMAEPGEEPTW